MLCVAEMLCVENNFVYVFCLMTFLFDDWMHALMTGEGGASSGSRVRIICKWVAATPRTICLSTNHWPCSGHAGHATNPTIWGSSAALFNKMIANYNLKPERCASIGKLELSSEGVVYNPSLSSSQKDENHISQIVTGGADNLGRWGWVGGGGKG